MNEKEIKTCIQQYIKSQIVEDKNIKINQDDDYSEERVSNMITVGIDSVEQLNFSLPDYKYTLNIVINSYIADDTTGVKFNQLSRDVSRMIQDIMNSHQFESVFGEIPVVGWINFNKQFTNDGQSNICSISSEIIASF